MIRKKIKGDLLGPTNLRFVILLSKVENVKREKNARKHTTVLKNFIIQINTRRSFVHPSLIKQESVNMEIIAPLHTLNQKFLLS